MQDSLDNELMDHRENKIKFGVNIGIDYIINEYNYFAFEFNDIEIGETIFKNNYGITIELETQKNNKQLLSLNLGIFYSPYQELLFNVGKTTFKNKYTDELDTSNLNSMITNQYYNISLGIVRNTKIIDNLVFRLHFISFEAFYFIRDKLKLLHNYNNYEIYDIANDKIIGTDLIDRNNKFKIGYGIGLALAYNIKFNSNFIEGLNIEAIWHRKYCMENSRIWMYRFSSLINF